MTRKKLRTQFTSDGLVIGIKRRPFFLDVYHLFLGKSWWHALGAIVGSFLSINLLFSIAYLSVGGVAGVATWLDGFAFSVQTMATIGYGGMAPVTVAAHILVIVEAVFGLLFTALSTGLVFAKFTLAPSSVVFARRATISAMNGVPTLAFRVSNERGNLIVDATARVVLVRTETTAEGVRWYRMLDLKLQRDWMPAVSRGWSMLHTIDASSPLYGATLAILARDEVEFVVSLNGLDQTTLQPTHSIKRFGDDDVQFGYRHADMTSINAEGVFVMDVRQFDETVAASL